MSDLHVYATRPAPPGAPDPATRGRSVTFRRAGLAYWLVAVYPAAPVRALDSLLFHAERRTLRWRANGWTDPTPPAGLGYELWRCDAQGQPRVTVARITEDDTLTVAHGFVELLPHRSLDAAVSTFTAAAKAVSGLTMQRVPRLTRITEDGEHLPFAKGAPV